MFEERPIDISPKVYKVKGKTTVVEESSQGASQQEIHKEGQHTIEKIRRLERGKAKILDFANVPEEINSSVPQPSTPHETFKEDEVVEVLNDHDRAIIPSVIPEDESNDERILASKKFMGDENFVNTPEFKSF